MKRAYAFLVAVILGLIALVQFVNDAIAAIMDDDYGD